MPKTPFVHPQAAVCRVYGCCALSGLLPYCVPVPRAMPWADVSLPPSGRRTMAHKQQRRTVNTREQQGRTTIAHDQQDRSANAHEA